MVGAYPHAMGERGRRRLGRVLLLIGSGLLVWWLWVTVDGLAFQAVVARRLEALDRPIRARALVKVATATRREADESGILGRIEVPRLKLSAPIIEGTTGRALRRGVGHVENTAYPGERGNVGLAGHRDTWFLALKGVERGDLIRLRTPDGTFAYAVESFRIVDPERGDLLVAGGEEARDRAGGVDPGVLVAGDERGLGGPPLVGRLGRPDRRQHGGQVDRRELDRALGTLGHRHHRGLGERGERIRRDACP